MSPREALIINPDLTMAADARGMVKRPSVICFVPGTEYIPPQPKPPPEPPTRSRKTRL